MIQGSGPRTPASARPPVRAHGPRRARSSALRTRSAAPAESRAVRGRLAPGIGITVGDRRESQARHTC